MSTMDRRTFLMHAGRWLALAALAPLAPGCAQAVTSTASAVSAGPEATATAGDPAGSATTAVAGPPDSTSTISTSTGAQAGGEGGAAAPDLAVVKGETVEKNVRAAIGLLGGMAMFVKQGGTVVVKPNVLTGRAPEYATTTSPELMKAVIALCWEAGAKEVTVLDNPTSDHRSAFKVSGLDRAVSDADGKLVYLSARDYQPYDIPQGKVLTSWDFVAQALEADTLIDLALPKAHSVSGATMTMKNLMGVMGGRRGSIHSNFSQKIVDVNTLVKPTLAILDGYRVLFRHGPAGGSLDDVRLDKTLVAGVNPVCVDAYGAAFFDKQPTAFKWLVEANARGMGEIDVSRLRIATGVA